MTLVRLFQKRVGKPILLELFMNQKQPSKNQIRRYPIYLDYLKRKQAEGVVYISSPQIADSLNLSEEQVRKDLNFVSRNFGKPKVGREIKLLIFDIEEFLGYRDSQRAVLVGAGHLGIALMAYEGFLHYGLDIVCAFDNDINKIDCIFYNKSIYSINELEKKWGTESSIKKRNKGVLIVIFYILTGLLLFFMFYTLKSYFC